MLLIIPKRFKLQFCHSEFISESHNHKKEAQWNHYNK